MESWAGEPEYWEGGAEGEGGDGEDREVEQTRDIEDGMLGEQADVLHDDEAEGLAFLNDMGDIPTDEKQYRREEEVDIDINLDS